MGGLFGRSRTALRPVGRECAERIARYVQSLCSDSTRTASYESAKSAAIVELGPQRSRRGDRYVRTSVRTCDRTSPIHGMQLPAVSRQSSEGDPGDGTSWPPSRGVRGTERCVLIAGLDPTEGAWRRLRVDGRPTTV